MAAKLVRFVVQCVHPDSQRRSGLFQLYWDLVAIPEITKEEAETLAEIREWFNENLERPERFARSLRPRRHPKAVSWFKPTAHEHIARMRELGAIFEKHGYIVSQVHTVRPGYVVYEDEFQVTAVPFSDQSDE